MLIWLDSETTGLSPEQCEMLEVAIVLTNERLEEIAVYESAIRFRGHIDNEWARNQHEKSGLLAECHEAEMTTAEAEQDILRFLRAHGVAAKAGVLAGSSIHFDRSFLRAKMPELDGFLHYRMVDTSSLNELSSRFAREVYEKRPTIPKADIPHRALADIRASIGLLRYYLDAGLFRNRVAPAAPKTRCVYLIVGTTRDGEELTTLAYDSREAAERKCRSLRESRGEGASVEAALDAIFFVREMRIQED